ncbi:hypothetical protein JW756_01345 [Candidatus Woesearchaeota archaeon]|nr:hypothetical protein [Candidatus Woesearchaeota archaeon]
MLRKKDIALILLCSAVSMGSVFGSQERLEHRLRFNLKPMHHQLIRGYGPFYFSLQKYMQRTGKDYMMLEGMPDVTFPNLSRFGTDKDVIVPGMSKYNMPVIKPGPEWGKYFRLGRFYQHDKLPPGILIYEWKHK